MDDNRRAFYEYHAALMEPWDGPRRDGVHRRTGRSAQRSTATACGRRAIVVTDDDLDRHGFRSRRARRSPKSKHRQEVAAAAGEDAAGRHWKRAASSTMTRSRSARSPTRKPYRDWIKRICVKLDALQDAVDMPTASASAAVETSSTCIAARPPAGVRLYAGGRTHPADADGGRTARRRWGRWATTRALDGARPTRPKPSSTTTSSQLFAQVTNPPIDPIREETGDVAGVVHRPAAQPPGRHRHATEPEMRLEVSTTDSSTPDRTWKSHPQHVELFSRGGKFKFRRARHLLSRRHGAATAWRPALASRSARARRVDAITSGLQRPHPVGSHGVDAKCWSPSRRCSRRPRCTNTW